MTKERFHEMADAVIGSGRFADGSPFLFFASGASVILTTHNGDNQQFPYTCEGWELDDDGEPYCYGTWMEQ